MRWDPWIPAETRYEYANECALIDRAVAKGTLVTTVVCSADQTKVGEVVTIEGHYVYRSKIKLSDSDLELSSFVEDGGEPDRRLFWGGVGLVLGQEPHWLHLADHKRTLAVHRLPESTLAYCSKCRGPLTLDLDDLLEAARGHRRRVPAFRAL